MAFVSDQRPDDRCGTGFLKHLSSLRVRQAVRGAVAFGSLPLCLWIAGRHTSEEGPERSAAADCGEVHLLVVEMGNAHLSRAPGFMPRVSWCMWGMDDEDEPVTGGPAPSFEDAMLRAELALRAHLGVKMDS